MKIYCVYKGFYRKKTTIIQSLSMRTSHAQLLEKGFQHGEEDSKNKILSLKEYITGEKVKIIEIIFLFFACLQAECA